MSLYLYRLRNLIRVLRHLVWEEFEERSRVKEDRDRPIRREGRGDHDLIWQLFNQVIQSCNHKGGGGFLDLSALKVVVLVNLSVIIVNMFFNFYNKARML